MRLRRKRGIEEELKKYPALITHGPDTLQGAWHQIFGNNRPLYLEIGTGKGGFIVQSAKLNPHKNYVGLEKVPEVLYKALVKQAEAEVDNLRFLHLDAVELPHYFAPGEVHRIYLNFSDPWPKKRHAKRRLTSPAFLKIYKTLLKKGGEIHFKTDDYDFFEYSLQEMMEAGFSLASITYDLHRNRKEEGIFEGPEDNILTEYELKFISQGKPIYRCEAIR